MTFVYARKRLKETPFGKKISQLGFEILNIYIYIFEQIFLELFNRINFKP